MSLETARLGEVASFIRGITFKPVDVVPRGVDGSVWCLRTKNVQAQLDLSDVWAIDASFVKRDEQYLQAGDLLVSSANSWNLIGKCSWVPQLESDATFGGFVTALRGNPQLVDRRYLYHWFSSSRTQAVVRSFSRQTTNIANLDLRRCSELAIPLPPLAQQKRIAAVLDQVDALRAKRREAIVLLDDLAQSIFLDMFGDPMKVARGAGTVSDAGVVQLGRQRAPKYQTGLYSKPYLRVANVFEDRIDLDDVLQMDFDESDFQKYCLKSGDILLNEGQSTELVGRPAMWRGEREGYCFQNTLLRFQARDGVLPDYALAVFLRYFRTGEFAKISSKTSSVAHLGAARFAKMPFHVPPIELQEKYRELISVTREQRERNAGHLAVLSELFISLQHRAFSGTLWDHEAPGEAA